MQSGALCPSAPPAWDKPTRYVPPNHRYVVEPRNGVLLDSYKVICYISVYHVLHWETESVRITLKLFAMFKEKAGRSELEISVAEGTTAGEVLETLIRDYPSLAGLANVTMFAVGEEFVSAETELKDGQQLAFLPPVSGG